MTNYTVPLPGPEQQDAPLTEPERRLLSRLFSDPTYFPVEFRTWIKSYLETSDIRLPSSAIVGGNAPRVDLPAGILLPYAGNTIPSNCLPCDGAAISRVDYALLFSAIGVLWGVGNGTSTFNVPDLRDRALFGVGTVVGMAATDGKALGSRGGPRHHHFVGINTDSQGGHNHGGTNGAGSHGHGLAGTTVQAINAADSVLAIPQTSGGGTYNVSSVGDHAHGINSDGGHAHNVNGNTTGGYDQDMPSWAGVRHIITTGKDV